MRKPSWDAEPIEVEFVREAYHLTADIVKWINNQPAAIRLVNAFCDATTDFLHAPEVYGDDPNRFYSSEDSTAVYFHDANNGAVEGSLYLCMDWVSHENFGREKVEVHLNFHERFCCPVHELLGCDPITNYEEYQAVSKEFHSKLRVNILILSYYDWIESALTVVLPPELLERFQALVAKIPAPINQEEEEED